MGRIGTIRVVMSAFAVCVALTASHGQLIPQFPIEIDFSPLSFGNQIPGNNPKQFGNFSSVKMFLYKDLYSARRLSNTLAFEGAFDFYQDITKARNYNPMYTQATSRTIFFVNDIYSIGCEAIGNIMTKPGTNKKGLLFNLLNYRGRVRPFQYVILTPDLIMQDIFTAGNSRDADSSMQEVSIGNYSLLKSDYDIYAFQTNFIYFTKFRTRLFLSPYVYYDRYADLPARSQDGSPDSRNPPLKERGIGAEIGAQYSTPNWGLSEGSFEYERNTDMIFDANSYSKLKAYLKSEFLYVTEWFGYSAMAQFTKYISKNFATGFTRESNLTGQLGQNEVITDCILIYNINKFFSVRPEHEFIYRYFRSSPSYKRSNFRLQLHVRF